MLSAVARVLKQHGYDTNLFASAEAFKGHNDYERVSCIILDVNLNDGSGIELRRGLKVAGRSPYLDANDTRFSAKLPRSESSAIRSRQRAPAGSRRRAACH